VDSFNAATLRNPLAVHAYAATDTGKTGMNSVAVSIDITRPIGKLIRYTNAAIAAVFALVTPSVRYAIEGTCPIQTALDLWSCQTIVFIDSTIAIIVKSVAVLLRSSHGPNRTRVLTSVSAVVVEVVPVWRAASDGTLSLNTPGGALRNITTEDTAATTIGRIRLQIKVFVNEAVAIIVCFITDLASTGRNGTVSFTAIAWIAIVIDVARLTLRDYALPHSATKDRMNTHAAVSTRPTMIRIRKDLNSNSIGLIRSTIAIVIDPVTDLRASDTICPHRPTVERNDFAGSTDVGHQWYFWFVASHAHDGEEQRQQKPGYMGMRNGHLGQIHTVILCRNSRFNQEQRCIDSICVLCYARLLTRPACIWRSLK
jgi:hypothetical protein